MKDRIRYSLIYMGVLVALFAVIFTTRVFEGEMTNQFKGHLREQFRLIETAYVNDSLASTPQKLAQFASKELRITLIDSSGTILYDSDAEASKMENHYNREEVTDAFAKGIGEDLRYSTTLQAKAFYFAKKLRDGNVLRIGMRQANLKQAYSKTVPYLIVLLAAIILAAIIIAFGLSRAFVRPLQKLVDLLGTSEWMNIENTYKEIAPLVNTIRKQDLELQLTIEQLSNEKKKISHLKDEFTANASHELKTPLTSISGYAELIENGMAQPEDVKMFAGKIHKEAKRLQSIANDIITLSKLNDHEGQPFDLNEKINLWNLSHSCIEGPYWRTPPRRSRDHDKAPRRRAPHGNFRHRGRTVLDGDHSHDGQLRQCGPAHAQASHPRYHGRQYRYNGDGMDNVHIRLPVQHEQYRVAVLRARYRAFLHQEKFRQEPRRIRVRFRLHVPRPYDAP